MKLQTDAAINPAIAAARSSIRRLVGVTRPRWLSPTRRPTQGLASQSPRKRSTSVASSNRSRKQAAAKNKNLPKSEVTDSQAQRLSGCNCKNLTPDLTDALGMCRVEGSWSARSNPKAPLTRESSAASHHRRPLQCFVHQAAGARRARGTRRQCDFTVGIVRANNQGQQVETVP
jgi:hypothetical protein